MKLALMRSAQAPEATWAYATSTQDAGFSDTHLVANAKVDREAFGAIYMRYRDRIHRYAYYRLGDHAEAEDVTSVTFERALASINSCQASHFRAWLFTIARNAVTDSQRAERRNVSLDHAAGAIDLRPAPLDLAAELESERRIHLLLARLPEGQRRIVELRLAGLKGTEIARVLGRSHVTVRVSQYRAYARLRDMLEQEPELLDGTT